MTRKNEMDMINGPLLPKIIRFILPLIATGMLQLLYNAADVVVVGRFEGHAALAAVGSTGSLINLILNVFMGLAVGASVAVAQDYGAGDHKGVHKVVHTSLLVSVIGGVFVGIIGVCFSGVFLGWMGTPEDVLPLATEYLMIYFLGAPGSLIYNFGASILRSVGDTKRPLFMLAISGLVNVVLNMIFVIVFHLGVVGVALATIISQYVSMVMVISYLTKVDNCCRLYLKELKIYRDKLTRIIRVGLPAGIQGSVFSLSNVVIQSSINSFGSLVVSGSTAASNIEGFAYTAMNSVYQASLTFIGQNIGARRYDRIHKVTFTCLGIVMAIGITVALVINIFAVPLLSLYLPNDPEAIPYGVTRLLYVCLPYFLCGMMEVFTGSQRGMGMSVTPMITSLVGSCLFRIVWIAVIFNVHKTLPALFMAYPISWLLTTTAHMIFYFNYKRKHYPSNGVPAVDTAIED